MRSFWASVMMVGVVGCGGNSNSTGGEAAPAGGVESSTGGVDSSMAGTASSMGGATSVAGTASSTAGSTSSGGGAASVGGAGAGATSTTAGESSIGNSFELPSDAQPLIDVGIPTWPDPVAATPDQTGEQPITDSFVLLKASEWDTVVADQLLLLNLTTSVATDLNDSDQILAYTTVAPDGSAFLFSGASAADDENLFLVRFSPDSYTPLTTVEGFVGRYDNYIVRDWSDDSRFALFGSSHGVDVVDTVLNRRVGSYGLPGTVMGRFAPQGYFFSFGYDGDGEVRNGIGKVTNTGLSEPRLLPAGSSGPQFTPDGRRGVFFTEAPGGGRIVYRIDLPGEVHEVPLEGVAPSAISTFKPTPDSQGLYVRVDEEGRWQIYHVDFDGSTRTPIGAPDRSADTVYASDSGNSYALTYQGDLIAFGDGMSFSEPIAMVAGAVATGGFHGEHLAYEVDDVEWHLVALGDGGVVDTRVSETNEAGFNCMDRHNQHPEGKAVFTHREEEPGMVLLDLSEPVPRRVLHIDPTEAGATLYCPVWSPDGTVFVYVERGEQGDRIRQVSWGAGDPEPPITVYESDLRFEITLFVH